MAGDDPTRELRRDGTEPLAPHEAAASLVGERIDDFAIEGVIGGGAFGTVYRARQLGLDRLVAIKVPTAAISIDPVMAKRFAREARAMARVHHPGIVAIHAVGELADGRPYIAMQLLVGEPLHRILRSGPLSPVRALRIVRAIASALAETHAASVVHRDLKPSNIVWHVDSAGDDRLVLVDFGIAVAREVDATDATRLTAAGAIGTPHYMAPEQAHGEAVDARADLYALGCLLFELVTGAPPFDGPGVEVLLAHMNTPAPAPSSLRPVPGELDSLCALLLAKSPADRPQTANEVIALVDTALARLSPSDISGLSATAIAPASPSARRRFPWFLLGFLSASALAACVFLFWPSTSDDEPPVPASRPSDKEVVRDDGELLIRARFPADIRARDQTAIHLSIVTKLGKPFVAKQVVVTIEDSSGLAAGLSVKARSDRPGHYAFRHAFPTPGHYIIRVFPSETETVSTFDIDVL
ncbi:MAG TPA: serine/threonine-protein kinase [Kofleriaceae bacterium]|jgi:serine/threonine protein kinase